MLYTGDPLVCDVLLKRYGCEFLSGAYFDSLDTTERREIIETALKKDREELMFQRWLIGGYDSAGMSFAEFRERLEGNISAPKSAEEILTNVEKIMDNTHWRAG